MRIIPRSFSRSTSLTALSGVGRTLGPDEGTINYRCYLWHVNEDTVPLYAVLTLRNTGNNAIHATNGLGVMFTDQAQSWGQPGFPPPFQLLSIVQGGRCIAQPMLARTLDTVPSIFKVVFPGTRISLLQWGPLSPGITYGVYLEFKIGDLAGDGWILREVYARSTAAC